MSSDNSTSNRHTPEPSTTLLIEEANVIDLLSRLVDKSLVVFEEGSGRYRLLDTVRRYAAEKFGQDSEREAIRKRHRNHFLALAEEASPKTEGAEAARWLDALEAEHDNLRAALEACAEDSEGGETGLRLAGSLQRLWDVRGYFGEGRERIANALAHPGAQGTTRTRADALNGAGNLADHQGDYAAARAFYEESLAIRRALRDRQGLARSLGNLGILAARHGDYDGARALHEETRALLCGLGDRNGEVIALLHLAGIPLHQGEYEAADRLFEEAAGLCRTLDNKGLLLYALDGKGETALLRGDLEQAGSLLGQSLALCREVGNRSITAIALSHLAEIAQRRAEPERAARLLGAAEALREQIGAPPGGSAMERPRVALRRDLGEEAFSKAFVEGGALDWKQAIRYALEEGEEEEGT